MTLPVELERCYRAVVSAWKLRDDLLELIETSDDEDKIKSYVVAIDLGLCCLFVNDEEAEQRWLSEPQECWEGQTPFQLIEGGRLDDVRRVSERLGEVRGLR